MREKFDRDMKEVKERLLRFASSVDTVLHLTVEDIKKGRSTHRQDILSREKTFAEYEQHIEKNIILLLLYQQPVAGDLRTLTAGLKMNRDMLRIGEEIIEVSRLLPTLPLPADVWFMSRVTALLVAVNELTYNAVHSYAAMSRDGCLAVLSQHNALAEHFPAVKEDVITALKNDTITPRAAVNILLACNHLTKTGEHAISFAAHTLYIITGEMTEYRLRHL